jgi:hypothetical protein
VVWFRKWVTFLKWIYVTVEWHLLQCNKVPDKMGILYRDRHADGQATC